MADYTLDLTAADVVRWLRTRLRSQRPGLVVRASRDYAAPVSARLREAGIGDDDDLAEAVEIGTLDVEPLGGGDGWTLHVQVENPFGPRAPADEPTPDYAEDIDLDTFDAEFVQCQEGEVYVWVSATSPEAKARFDEILPAIRGTAS